MKYYYDKEGAFLGANNENAEPQGSAGFTHEKPEHGGMFFDVVNNLWADEKAEVED